MIVRLHQGKHSYFMRKARKSLPNEIFAYLLGKQVHNGLIEVHDFYYPELDVSTPGEVTTVSFDIDSYAKQKSLQMVGDIHSHPNGLPVMSPSDHCDHHKNGNKITAILEVPQNGRSRLVIWRGHTPLPCSIQFIKEL